MKRTIILLIILLLITGCSLVSEKQYSHIQNDYSDTPSSETSSSQIIQSNGSEYSFVNSSYEEWLNSTKEDNYVLTLIASTSCHFCNDFKPILINVLKTYQLPLYIFNVDEIEYTENILNTYETNFAGSVPHLFITKNGNVISNKTASMNEEELIEYLKLNLIIE